MPDDGVLAVTDALAEVDGGSGRATALAFLADAQSEAVIREGLVEVIPTGLEVRRGGIRGAIAAMQKMQTPYNLIVDVSGEAQPFSLLSDLSEVVEPDVRVLVVGDREDMNFYRQLTRGLGIAEYIYKPLTRDMVVRHFAPVIGRQAAGGLATQGGRVVTVTGTVGGAGATTIAANLAWHFGVNAKRHTLLLDPNLHNGCAAMLLGARSGGGLRTAMETPDRVDELFVERSAQPAAERLDVLASEEKLIDEPVMLREAAARLLQIVRRRYNFVVVDAPFGPAPIYREFLDRAHQRILVMRPSLVSLRDTLRMLALPNGPQQARRALVVLNGAGEPGSLSTRQIEEALKIKIDVTIPYLPRVTNTAANMGEPAVGQRGAFRSAILELAREVAFVRFEEGDSGGAGVLSPAAATAKLLRWRR